MLLCDTEDPCLPNFVSFLEQLIEESAARDVVPILRVWTFCLVINENYTIWNHQPTWATLQRLLQDPLPEDIAYEIVKCVFVMLELEVCQRGILTNF
jgi:hypothetical protein